MPDEKITALTALTTPAATDLLAVVDMAGTPTTKKTQVAALSPWFNVRNYGATGNGSTDDRAAIQSAIDAAATGGGTVFFPAGTYLLSSRNGVSGKHSLTLASNIRLIGTGTASIIKAGDSLPTDTPMLWGTNIVDFEGAYLQIDGNKARMAAGLRGTLEDEGFDFKGVSTTRVWLHHIYIHDCGQDAIDVDDAPADFIISDCVIANNGGAGLHGTASRVHISNTASRSNGLERRTNNVGDVADQSGGFTLMGSASNSVISGCTSEGDARGIVLSDSQARIAVLGCVINAPVAEGIWIRGTGTNDYIVIQGCVLRSSSGGVGVRLTQGSNLTLGGNSFNGHSPSVLVDGAGHMNLNGNMMVPTTGGRGITVTAVAASTHRLFTNNLIRNTTDGIRLEVGGAHMIGNQFEAITGFGIDIRAAAITDCSLLNNRVRVSGAGVAIRFLNSPTNITVEGNDTPAAVGLVTTGTGHKIAHAGNGTPEAVIHAAIGSTWRRLDGGAGTSFYIKETGTGNTGWRAV